jgi:predicted ATPase/DNA-binding SARP family transcriptional activator
MPRLSLRFLGPPIIELDGEPVHLGRHKAVALLAYLALTGQPHSRDALATLLWPELDQSHARGQLRRTLSLLNRTLGRQWLAVDRETAAWAGEAEAWVDVDVLRERLTACVGHSHSSQETCAECIPLRTEAVDLYRDGFLAGFTLPDAPAFDEWQFFEGEGLRDEAADALQRLARLYGDQGDYDAAIPYARRWLALDPLHEPAQRELMALYARSGQRAAALRQYGECERVLGEELGVAPSPETKALYERIRDHPGTRSLAENGSLGSLPEQLTPFVGRERELAELSALLSPTAEARLVTVVGPGGMGKTRLALEAVSRQLDLYPDGVWFVPLASAESAEAIAPTVAQVLGMSFFGPDPPGQQLLRYLRGKRMLLVLDNLEHLLEGVDLLVEILRTDPGVRILVTSRARLNARGEQVLVLHGMNYPERGEGRPLADEMQRYDSVGLFARSARRARPTFELQEEDLPHVARICQLAQGMPLAILLAAAWVPALSTAEIAAEMERSLDFLAADWRDEPERHHSMRAMFDATWQRLTEKERAVFARLSVFRGGFTREAAQVVAGADLRTLSALVIKSLLQRDRGGRYEVHELLRQYAEGKLEEVPEEREEALDKHAAYYTEFLACQELDIWKGTLEETLREIDNIRAAWRRVTAHGDVAQIHQCLCSLWILYQGSFLAQEGEPVFAEATKVLQPRTGEEVDEERAAAWGLALVMQGYFAAWFGHVDRGTACVEEGLSVLHRLGERREIAVGNLVAVSGVLHLEGTSRARQLLEESLALSRKLDLHPVMVMVLAQYNLAFLALHDDGTVAEQYAREALAVARQIDDRYGAALVLTMLGHIAYGRADHAQARQYYERGLALFQQTGHLWAVGRLCSHLGDVAIAIGDYGAAEEHHRRALTRYRELGFYWVEVSAPIGGCWGVPISMQRLGDVALSVGDAVGAWKHYRDSVQMAIDHPYPELQLYVLLGPARLWIQEGHVERAVELAALAWHHRASVEETRDRADELLDRLRDKLPPKAYAAAEARGRARDVEATVRELLAELEAAKRESR